MNKTGKHISLTLFFIMACGTVTADNLFADKGYKHNNKGNKLFENKDYEKSISEYTRALTHRNDNALIKYNLANTLVESGNLEDALKTYSEIENEFPESEKNKLYYNIGNTLFKNEKLEEAADFYKKSLMLKPDDMSAKENLELCLKKMQQQQQNQENQDNKENKDKKDQKDKQDQQKQDQQDKKDQQKQNQQNEEENKQQQEQKKQQKPKTEREKKKQDIEKMLQALAEQEKRDKKKNDKKKKAAVVDRPVKDW